MQCAALGGLARLSEAIVGVLATAEIAEDRELQTKIVERLFPERGFPTHGAIAVLAPTWAPELTDDALGRLARGRGRVVMAASRGDGLAYVMSGARHGLFTEHLLAGLRGAAGRGDGFVRVLDLYDHIQRNVSPAIRRSGPC